METTQTSSGPRPMSSRRAPISRGTAASLVVGVVGGLSAVYLPSGMAGFDVPLPALVLTGVAGALVGRGWSGLIAVLGGTALGWTVGLVAWGMLDLSGAQYIPLAAVILAVATPIPVCGAYALVRGGAVIVDRLRRGS